MLGSRTKQINAYGKRGKRIIDATGETNQSFSGAEIISIFDDLPPPPEWKSVASKMKKRENAVLPKSGSTSTKVVGLQRKKRLSPVLFPAKKKLATRVGQLIDLETGQKPSSVGLKSKPKAVASGNAADPIVLSASPIRAPLSAVALNIPGSPTVRNAHQATNAHSIKAKKPFSPYVDVDVDIIVLDGEGRTVRTEKRVSRRDLEANSIQNPSRPQKQSLPKRVASPEEPDNDCEIVSQPRRAQRAVARKPIILSDDSDSEIDGAQSGEVAKEPFTTTQIPYTKLSSASATIQSRSKPHSKMEVLIPRAPYKISRPISTISGPEPTFAGPSQSPLPVIEKHIPPPFPKLNTALSFAKARYQYNDSPMQKARQLTPIRGGVRRLFEPPSPTTPTDYDISLDFSDLSIGPISPTQGVYQHDFTIPNYLIPLLEECHQEACGPHNFSTFIESFRYDPILQSARSIDGPDLEFRKIGEASYSEVFGIGDVVLKVIPLTDESKMALQDEGLDGPAPSDAKDVRKEIIVTRAMGEVHDGFVKLLKTYVVRGKYPEVLLNLWDEYNERKGSESMRPDNFKVSQVYAIIVLPNGGPDLEAYTFTNASRTGWRQACSLFWQVTKALAHAEHLVSFEHRDLHWGQVLVRNVPTNALKSLNLNHKKLKSNRLYMDDLAHGVQATVIDLGLSRMDAGDGSGGDEVHWTPFDDEVFMGEGDYQFDVYRMMKHLTGGSWAEYHSVTNILWLHYMLQKLIYSKGIKPPAVSRKPKVTTAETPLPPPGDPAFSEKDCYECLVDIENWLGSAIAGIVPANIRAPVKGKGRRKTPPPVQRTVSVGPTCAGEIVAYGVKKGWIKASSLT